MNKLSFSIDGFNFHLTQVSNIAYQDQHGSFWTKKGNQFISEGGGMIHTLKAADYMDNKDYSHLVRQMGAFSREQQESYYADRIMLTKGFCK